MSQLAGRHALITGASSGIGEAAALALAVAGATVALTGRRRDRLDALAERIRAAGGSAIALPGDMTQEDAAADVVKGAVAQLGGLDILVNSAGIAWPGTVVRADTEVWRQVIDTNLMATLFPSRAAIDHMCEHGGGDIINISSMAARRPSPIFNPYSVSKAALNSMNYGMREEVAQFGIRVCVIMPGATTTEVAESIPDAGYREFMHAHVHKADAMSAGSVAAAIVFVVSLPPEANISELHIRPTTDTAVIG